MTQRKNRKRLARERAAKTGESYVTALRVIRAHSQETTVTTPSDETPTNDRTNAGAFLVSAGLLSQEDLESALDEQSRTNKALGPILLDRRLVDEAGLMAALAAQIGMDFVDLDQYPINPSAAALISDAVARRYCALPIGWDEGRVIVAMADPGNLFAIDHIRTDAQSDVKTVLATRGAIVAAIDRTPSAPPPSS